MTDGVRGDLQQVRSGILIGARLMALACAFVSCFVTIWAYTSAREASTLSSRAVDGFGRLIGEVLGGAGALFYSIIAMISGLVFIASAGWALAMHYRLRALRSKNKPAEPE
jgi:hypothetical protein